MLARWHFYETVLSCPELCLLVRELLQNCRALKRLTAEHWVVVPDPLILIEGYLVRPGTTEGI